MRWDIFCRVIDNHGDLGVCWRLTADLAGRGEAVRLWVDDPAALAWMAPGGAQGVELVQWGDPAPDLPPGDVVVEAFGCDPPAAFVEHMRHAPPVWINLEYLSAEGFVERSHRLPSPCAGVTKWFFFPGFTERTGGLLREPGLLAERAAFDRDAWLTALGAPRAAAERVVSLFAYPDAAVAELLPRLDTEPTFLMLCPGTTQQACLALANAERRFGRHLRLHALPWLSQAGYDRLLWAGDLNFARGEDSIVRAMWAGAPFVWHIYPQHDGAHAAKLEALLDRMDAGPATRALWRAWNGLGPWPETLPARARQCAEATAWRDGLAAQPDLVTRLLRFVAEKS